MSKEDQKLQKQTVSGVLWSFLERVLAQGVSFIVSIVLARMLMPEEYGTIAIVLVIINICNVFFNAGISTSLIQKKSVDELDYSSAFWTGFGAAVLQYGVIWVSAPYIAAFYDSAILLGVIRWMGLSVVISSLKTVQKAYVSRKMQFRKFFWATLGGTIISAIVGIGMAYIGMGVWALVAQYMSNLMIDTIVLGLSIEWKPKWMFSFNRMRELFSFGWKVLTASLIYTIYEDIRTLIIGKVYSSEELAFYNKGKQLPGFVVNNVNSAISTALLPAMSKLQDDVGQMKAVLRRFNRTGGFIMMPMLVGLAVIARPLVEWMLTDKWLFCVPYLQLMCIYYAFMPMQEANTQAVLATGRSDISLKAEIIKRVINLVIIICTYRISVKALAWGELGSMMISFLINASISQKLFGYGIIDQIKDILPCIVMSIVMGAIVYSVSFMTLNVGAMLCIQIILGGCVYVGLSAIRKDESFMYMINVFHEFTHRN